MFYTTEILSSYPGEEEPFYKFAFRYKPMTFRTPTTNSISPFTYGKSPIH